ncbi:tyrosine-protein kinase JAK3 isoform X4 [Hyla sarda]|uniref:tyrosine-protein kinase JAK3 isoform X4 n=1 Tax=Hyla sarda TaxID=327740 RepID=UPI0024C42A1F|nr:tyrosine-protein kinase JAK3 isoform X4 [Hyla sarda]
MHGCLCMSGDDAPLLCGSHSCSSYSSATGSLKLLFYTSSLPSSSQSDPQMVFSGGQYSAEELCIAAAKSCEILPVYHSLFALASPDLKTWYNPNHIFTLDGGITHVVIYRIRFFFPDWIGTSEQKSARCSLMNLSPEPVLSYHVIDYLFSQYRSDFINGRIELPVSIDVQEQCLALAVLDMMRLAQENDKTPKQILSSISYKHCVPQSLRQSIVNLNFFCRKRLRRSVQNSLKKMRACTLSVSLIKIKYLVDLEKLDPCFGTETFIVKSIKEDNKDLVLKVSWCGGITWKEVDSELWQPFSDFEDIVDIRITQANSDQTSEEGRIVTITKQNNKVLEAQFQMLRDALSFVSLVDGYYRLTTDSQHYFCEEVAPPRLRWNLDNHCHGPITSEFAIDKLKRNGSAGGSYILRRCLQDYDKFLLTVCLETALGIHFQGCSIQRKNDTFCLSGISRYFSSLRNLLEYYQHNSLCLGGVSTCLTSCCPPRTKEKSNLLIKHDSCPQRNLSPKGQRRNIPLLTFQKIHLKDITFLESQGKGSFTKIFHGLRRDADGEEEHEIDVLLKILDATHQHYQESFLEAASLMNQLFHKHQVLLHGVCVGKQMLLERIPWLAPECVTDVRNLALESDCWSFGVTMWEIFNDGIVPLNAEEPEKKLQFYKDQMQLPAPHWIELASLEQQCMSYNPALRSPFRSVIRELNNLIASDYELLVDSKGQQMKDGFRVCDRVWEYQDPNVYEERHLKYISVIGKGNFGSVELCRYDPLGDNTGELVAVKKLQHSTAEHVRDFNRESLILRALHNDYVVKYKGICYSAGRRSFQLVMEYLPNGSLQEFLPKNKDGLGFHDLLLYASQICKGMLYLGSQRYLHRDLASRNILVQSPSHVKIGDFGLTKILPQDKEYYVVREQGQSPIFWHAPESLSDNIYSRESDVWSFGVLLYELFTYCERSYSPSAEYRRMMGPHNSQQTVCGLVELLRAKERLRRPPSCPLEVHEMMKSCWSFQPSERPTFSALENQCEELRRTHQRRPRFS